jgi:pRiA4b ORF-3-like protein
VLLSRFGLRERERFTYDYDFCDCWRHDIRVEKILASVPGKCYPICTGGARSAPPEDCGGPRAFLAWRQHHPMVVPLGRMAEIITEVLAQPDDQTRRDYLADHHEEMAALQRLGRLDDFDRAALNRALHAHPSFGGSRP